MRMIFVNLPVKDVAASRRFFEALGFVANEQFSGPTAAAMAIEENISVMLLAESHFRQFINGDIADAHRTTEVLTCLSASSREEVDSMLAKALAAGARPWKPAQDHGFMYGISFQDLDGHVWEVMWMDMAAVPQDIAQAEPA